MRRIAFASTLIALILMGACSKSAAPPPPPASSVPFEVRSVSVSGPGASSAEGKKQQTADEMAAPVKNYFTKAYFGVEHPASDFKAAFDGFTPSIAAAATGAQAETLTLGPLAPQVKELHATRLNATVSIYADSDGSMNTGVVKVDAVGEGSLVNGDPISISHNDDFYLVKSGANWMVTGYVVSQKIDAPPVASGETTATATAGASPSTARSVVASPTRSASPTKTSTKRKATRSA